MTFGLNASLIRALALIAVLGLGSIGLAACDESGPAEEAGEAVDDAVESTGEAVEDAGDAAEDATN